MIDDLRSRILEYWNQDEILHEEENHDERDIARYTNQTNTSKKNTREHNNNNKHHVSTNKNRRR